MAEESKITLENPQSKQSLDIKDPSTTDGTAKFNYNSDTNFKIDNYKTFTQDVKNHDSPIGFLNNDKFAPTSSPFILELNGSGFNITKQSSPFKIYAEIDGYLASIPQLSTSTNLNIGNAFGYVVKSTTKLFIYFNRILFQEIWFRPVTNPFDGEDGINTIQIESGISKYPFIKDIKPLIIHVAANNDEFVKSNFFIANDFKDITVTLTQSPFIITDLGNENGGATMPFVVKDGDTTKKFVTLFGHSLYEGGARKVMMVKTSSTLLKQNPSSLPKNVIDAKQDASTIQSTDAQTIANLDFFKIGFFLNELQSLASSEISDYSYFTADRTIAKSGNSGQLPKDNLPTIKFEINTLPAGVYDIVVYDDTTGVYSISPVPITINNNVGGMQIHNVSPTSIVLENPTLKINGFNFPVQKDIENGATFTVALVNKNKNSIFGLTSQLKITKDSTSNDIANNGSISLTSDAEFTAKFTNLHASSISDNSVFLLATVINSNGQINESLSRTIFVKKSPIISFLTNSSNAPRDNSKSLVRVDQTTGKVIVDGVVEDNLYIVGKNFIGKNVSVLIKGNAQSVEDIVSWGPDPSLTAIIVKVEPGDMKGDVTVEVKIDDISSEPFIYTFFEKFNGEVTTNTNGIFVKNQTYVDIPGLEKLLPYNHLDGKYILLNSSNTKTSSSVKLNLLNKTTKDNINLDGKSDSQTSLSFLPDQMLVPANTQLTNNGMLSISFNFYNIFNINLSEPKIVRLQHDNGSFKNTTFKTNEVMTVVGNGFVDGMRFNINNVGWAPVTSLFPIEIDNIMHQAFLCLVPSSGGNNEATIKVSNDQAQSVSSANASGMQNGPYKVDTIVVNDKYSPLLQINQRLPAGIKMYAKGPQVAMTDKIDANMSIYGQMTPFLGSFKTLLIVIRIIVCIIDVICALINPFKLVMAIIALMDCVIDLLSLFPQLAVPIMILSFLQNFIGFLLTFVEQIKTYVLSIVNSQLALVNAQSSKDFASLAAGEQQSFGATKQIRDVIAFLEPPMQIVKIFKDLLMFSMHLPCAGNHGGTQDNGDCPPPNILDLMKTSNKESYVEGEMEVLGLVPLVIPKKDGASTITMSAMFCQAIALQTATLATMPGAPIPGASSIVSNISPTLPNISSAIECMSLLTDKIENSLNNGKIFITTPEQGAAQLNEFTQCVQNLIDQTNQAIGDVCVLAISALNSELKVSPKGSLNNSFGDDFIRTKIPLPSTQPNDTQDAGLTIDLATLNTLNDIPASISTDMSSGLSNDSLNFGLKQDIYTPIIVQTSNKTGQRQSINTIYFNSENFDVGDLIVPGDILEIVGGTFNGLQFPIISIQKIFTAVRLTVKLDITFEQKLLVGEQSIPENLSGFDVKIIAHLAGNDAVAVVPADDTSFATVQVIARDHHGHEIGPGLANKVAIKIESGDGEFIPITPSNSTDITGVIQESGDHYIANLKSDCAGTTIISASVCNIEFQDIGYHAKDPNHAITTRTKTVKIIFTPPIPRPTKGDFNQHVRPQEPGTNFIN